MSTPPPLYTSRLSLPYSSKSTLNTLDIHTPTPTNPPLSPSYNLIFIHGGAFRDPLQTSLSLLPSLPLLFQPNQHHLASISSLNYRLCPHPTHATDPSQAGDRARNAAWPDAIEDIRDGVRWLKAHGEGFGQGGEKGGEEGEEWIVCGHSVGGTMAVMLGMDSTGSSNSHAKAGKNAWSGSQPWGQEGGMEHLKAVITLSGIYNFTSCRDAHAPLRAMYDAFTTGAFGREEDGGWERGNILGCGRVVRDGVEVVVVGHSREDELVEWGQGEALVGVLMEEGEGEGTGRGRGRGRGGEEVRFVEVEGTHAQIVGDGVAVGKCVDVAVGVLVERAKAKAKAQEGG